MPDRLGPQHPIVAELYASLNENEREFYEERAGVLEFEANLDRPLAEALAMLEAIRRYGWPPKPRI